MKDIERRLTDMIHDAREGKKAIHFIVITPPDFTALTGLTPTVDTDLGNYVGLPLKLGPKTEIKIRKTPNV